MVKVVETYLIGYESRRSIRKKNQLQTEISKQTEWKMSSASTSRLPMERTSR